MKEIQREEETFGKVKWWRNSLFSLRNKWKMESLIVAANIIKAALSNFFHINIELDGSTAYFRHFFSSFSCFDQKMVLHLQYWKGYNRTGAEWHNGIHLVRCSWHILMSYTKMGLIPGQPTTDVHTSGKGSTGIFWPPSQTKRHHKRCDLLGKSASQANPAWT